MAEEPYKGAHFVVKIISLLVLPCSIQVNLIRLGAFNSDVIAWIYFLLNFHIP